MNRYITVGCFVALNSLAAGIDLAHAQWGQGRAGACFYGDANFKGSSFCANVGETLRQLPAGTEGQVSSIEVFGNATVVVFTDRNLQGASQQINSSVSNLARTNWNDRIASVRVVGARPVGGRGRGGWGDAVSNGDSWGYPQEPSTGACFYEDANYRGQYFCSDTGTRMAQVPYGSNSRISSIRIFGNAQVTVYPTRGFRGGYRQFGSSVSNLDRTGWNDSIESIRVEPRSYSDGFDPEDSSWNRGRSVTPSVGACFYQDADYRGQYFCTRAGVEQPDLPAEALNQISSIRVFGDAVVTVYMQQDFRGQSRTVSSDVRNLDGTGWNDRIESFRISSRNSSDGGNYPLPPWRDR